MGFVNRMTLTEVLILLCFANKNTHKRNLSKFIKKYHIYHLETGEIKDMLVKYAVY